MADMARGGRDRGAGKPAQQKATPSRWHGDTAFVRLLYKLGWVAVPLLTILVYLPSLKFGFVWDDDQVLFGRADYHDPSRWLEAVRQPLDFSPNYFRPLALSTQLIQIWVWGNNPLPFHLVNVLLHGLNTLLVMILAARWLRWMGDDTHNVGRYGGLSLLAGLLYGLHPALTESVAFIASRYDLTVTTFLLLALLCEGRVLLMGCWFLLAMLCKEMAIVLPLLLPAWHMMRSARRFSELSMRERVKQIWHDEWRAYLVLFVAGMLYLGLRYAALGYLHQPSPQESRMEVGSPLQHLLLIGRTFATLIGLVFFPFFSITPAHHSTLPIPLNDGVAWLQLGLTGAAILLLIGLVRRAPVVGWLLVAAVVSLLPVLNLRPLEIAKGLYTAERFLTFPLTLFVLALVAAFASGRISVRKWAALGAAAWLLTAVVVIALNLPNWRENRTLWEWMARASPQSPIGHGNLADAYNNLGRYEDALKAADRAIRIAPWFGTGWVNKGVALLKLGHPKEAEAHFRKATELEPTGVIGWNNLAMMLSDRGEFAEAERIIRQHVLGRTPLFMGHEALGILYLKQARPDLAEPELEQALRHLPFPKGTLVEQLLMDVRRPALWLAAAEYQIRQGNLTVAERLCQRAAELGADRVALAYVRGKLLIAQGRPQQARQLAQELLDYGLQDPRLQELLRLTEKASPTRR
jgi:tetratricopeptide (TPR) repeat protein